MILLIDNYDSFTYNLAHYVAEIEPDVVVVRNDEIDFDQLSVTPPTHIIISPGPGDPNQTGACREILRLYSERIPILGVCLGHQLLASYFGAQVVRADQPMHGKTSVICNNGSGVFRGLPGEYTVMRYHSLVVNACPSDLIVTAWSKERGEIMALRHKNLPLEGVQFHPESILSQYGKELLANFLTNSN